MRIIPVASGKGGVGKSLTSANLGVAFAQAGKKTVVADLDLGASNLHLVLGHHSANPGLGHFLNNTKSNFHEVIAETDIPNLRFIPGDGETPGMANLGAAQRNALIRNLLALKSEADILILDLGAGTHQSILDFFLLSTKGIVVSAPSVTAVLTAYVFLKNAVFRLMYSVFKKGTPAGALLETMRKDVSGKTRQYIPQMIQEIERVDPIACVRFRQNISSFHPRLIMNMIEDPSDADVAMKIRRSCEAYLGLGIEHLGVLYRDSFQDTALQSRLPVVLYKPQAILSQGIYRIAEKILQSEEDRFDLAASEIEASFQEAALEAEADFENKSDYVEELLHSGALSQGDLLETVKTQQLEISKLKKENSFLKMKLSQAVARGFVPQAGRHG